MAVRRRFIPSLSVPGGKRGPTENSDPEIEYRLGWKLLFTLERNRQLKPTVFFYDDCYFFIFWCTSRLRHCPHVFSISEDIGCYTAHWILSEPLLGSLVSNRQPPGDHNLHLKLGGRVSP